MNFARRALKGVTYYDPLKADSGYTLFNPTGTNAWNTSVTDTWLIDMEGNIVHRWRMRYRPGLHSILLPNGRLLSAGMTKGPGELNLPSDFAGFGGELEELDWDGNVVWELETPFQNHDFMVMPNGNIMYMVYGDPEAAFPDEVAAKWKGGIPGTEVRGKLYGDALYEIDRDGKRVWEWFAYEHLDPEIDAICPLEHRSHLHFNSLFLCQDGNILISPRHLNEVFKIEYPGGKVIARYGKGKIFHQHDARELDNGNILVFDNGAHRNNYEPSYSRSVEIDPNTDEIVWEYKAELPSDFYAGVASANERLPNGNTFITHSNFGRLFEVTHEGELVWEYLNPVMGTSWTGRYCPWIFRFHRYPRDYAGLKGRDLDPANYPWENRFYGPATFRKDFAPLIF